MITLPCTLPVPIQFIAEVSKLDIYRRLLGRTVDVDGRPATISRVTCVTDSPSQILVEALLQPVAGEA